VCRPTGRADRLPAVSRLLVNPAAPEEGLPMLSAQRTSFKGSLGEDLAARLDMPAGQVRAFALFAHCFTCSKDVFAASRISAELASRGIAVLRFDFTGLGASGGDFANTSFSSNVRDLMRAADFLRGHFEAPSLLIGHSLGGTAVLCAAGDVPEAKAIVTIGSPANAEHVLHNFGAELGRIETEGAAEVTLAGRNFRIRKDFVEDARSQDVAAKIASLRKALLVLHSPTDAIVGIDNARAIYESARHPKSFIALDGADHLLTGREDAIFAARMISSWASRYLDTEAFVDEEHEPEGVLVAESGQGRFQQLVRVGPHRLLADEPTDVGGDGSGPSPYDLLSAALGTCTSMTLRLYAEHKKFDVGRISVEVRHSRTHAEDCKDTTEDRKGEVSRFDRIIAIEGAMAEETRERLLAIADRCPVHRTLGEKSIITTRFGAAGGDATG
jgi:putative redox protein